MPKKTLTLNIIHLPLMLLMLALVVGSGGIAAISQNTPSTEDSSTEVLSEDDDRDDEEDEDENEDDDDSDDSNDDNKDKSGDDDKDDDNDSEDDDSDDDSDKDDDDKGKSEQEFEREIEKNGVKMKEKVKVKTENGKTETEYEYELENEYDADDDADDLEEMEDVDESSDSSEDLSKYLKIKVHEANENSQGASADTRVKIMVKQGLEDAGLEDSIEELELTLDESSESMQYKGVAQKSEALLGLFKISIPVDLVIDPETGEVVDQSQTLVSKILDIFSF